MNASRLLCELEARGAIVTRNGGQLDIEAPRGVLTPQVLAAVKAHKPQVLALLAAPRDATGTASEAATNETDTAIESAMQSDPASTCGHREKRVALPTANAAMRAAITPESLAIASRLHRRLIGSGAKFRVARRAGCWRFDEPRLCVEWQSMEASDWQQVLALRAELQKIVAGFDSPKLGNRSRSRPEAENQNEPRPPKRFARNAI
jgi:hypothetical protein